ncbi:hypothetical protein FIBSPDRAFT_809743, partial [Athelia psychrophila]
METLGFGKNLLSLIAHFISLLSGIGVYLIILPRCINVLRQKEIKAGLLGYLLATAVISLLLIAAHWIVDLVRAFSAFTGSMSIANSPEAYFANVNTALNIAKTACYVAVTLLADAMLLYRTYIVWGRSWLICIVPVLLFGLDISMSVWFTWSINQATPGSSVLVSTVFQRCKYFYGATLAMNLCCTILIAARIWKIQYNANVFRSPGAKRMNILAIIVESAAIYSVGLICLIALAMVGSSVMFSFLNAMPPVIGCVFSFIIIASSTKVKTFNTSVSVGGATHSISQARIRQSHVGGNEVNTMHSDGGVVIHLDRVVHVDDR